jgi:neutral ceramidase
MLRDLTRVLGGALVMIGFTVASGEEAAERVFRAGAAMSNITPALGVSLAGHMVDRKASHVHDELHARCLVLDDGTTQLAFVLIDSCMVPREVLDEAKQRVQAATGLPVENMLMAATHTHTAACATPVFQSDADEDYAQFLTTRIADGVQRAMTNLAPARIGWGVGNLPEEVFNRRWHMKPGTAGEDPFGKTNDTVKMNPPRASENLIEPAGPTDPEIPFLAVQHLDGRPMALLANYALHYVGGTRGNEVSADYFGIFATRIEQLLGAERQDPPFVGMMSNGTSGDINNINFREPGKAQAPYEQMTIVANKAAAEVYRAYQTVPFHEWVALASAQAEIELGVRLPAPEEVEEARAIVAAAEGPEMRGLREIYARETVLLSDYPATVPVILQAFRVGDAGIAAVPCEVFVEIGLLVKEKSPLRPAFTIELANGYNGYLPTAAQHALGGYETWRARSSYLEVNAADKISETILRLLGEVAQ